MSKAAEMSPQELRYDWTYTDYARLPDDGNRYEVIDGELLVTPSPSPYHQRVAFRLSVGLDGYVQEHGLGVVIPDVDLLLQTGQFLRPDLLVVPTAGRSRITDRGVETVPLLVVEVLSPSSATIDRAKKPVRYRDFGVPEYWVIDPEERCAWVWRFKEGGDQPERTGARLAWHPDGATAGLSVDLGAILAPL